MAAAVFRNPELEHLTANEKASITNIRENCGDAFDDLPGDRDLPRNARAAWHTKEQYSVESRQYFLLR